VVVRGREGGKNGGNGKLGEKCEDVVKGKVGELAKRSWQCGKDR